MLQSIPRLHPHLAIFNRHQPLSALSPRAATTAAHFSPLTMVVSLIGPVDSPLVHRVLIVAAYAGIQLKLVPLQLGQENETVAYQQNCHPLRRIPVLKTDEGYLFESNAMVRYLSRTEVMMAALTAGSTATTAVASKDKYPHPQYPVPYAMYGHSLLESTQVDSWLDFAAVRLDAYTKILAAAEESSAVRKELWRNLAGLERRLKYLKKNRKALVEQSGCLTARTAPTDDELIWNEEEYMATRANRDTRLSSVYNVAGSIRQKIDEKDRQEREKQYESIKQQTEILQEDGFDYGGYNGSAGLQRRASSPRDSTLMSPRASILMSARGGSALTTGRGGVTGGAALVQRQDLIFLVGDSLTAADVVIAMALNDIYAVKAIKAEAVELFPGCFRYYKNMMTLPIFTDLREALKIKIIIR